MTALFLCIPLLTLAASVAGVWSVWMRRAVLAAALPTLLAGLAWSAVALPWAQDVAGCDKQAAWSALALSAALLLTLSAVVTAGTLLRLRSTVRWTVLLPAVLAMLAIQGWTGMRTATVAMAWQFGCH